MSTHEEFSITFGFPEFWPEVVKRHKNFFEPGNRLQQGEYDIV